MRVRLQGESLPAKPVQGGASAPSVLIALLVGTAAFAQVPGPLNFTVSRTSIECAHLSWTPVALNAEEYEIHRSDPSHPDRVVGRAARTASSYDDCALGPGAYSYFLRVTPKVGIGAIFGLTPGTTHFEFESSLPTMPRQWGNRIGGISPAGYCIPHVSAGVDDPWDRDCWYPLPDSLHHYRMRACDANGCTPGWTEQPHLRCGPLLANGGCRCAIYPSEPGCAP